MMFGTFLIFAIGLDRLLAIVSPKFYWQMVPSKYIGLILFSGGLYSLILFGITYYIDKDVTTMVTINPASLFTGPMITVFVYCQVVFICLAILTYILIWIIVIFTVKSKSVHMKLLKPITAILVFIIIGWLFNLAYGFYIDMIGLREKDEEAFMILHMYTGISINLGVVSDYFVYFVFSKDYRSAFCRQLGITQPDLMTQSKLYQKARDTNRVHVAVSTIH
ncbi:hypothetical protein FO519_008397 [Halicephalobus sp. NKZ332]|nr:hypothetical protein FO519_008397 [Halicephalobus sp. NKZ332]